MRGRTRCFFFQAEDGIRDRNVTGVQTCALPICHSSGAPDPDDHLRRARPPAERRGRAGARLWPDRNGPDPAWLSERHVPAGPGGRGTRSEEHTSELQSRFDLVCRLLLEKKKIYESTLRIRRSPSRNSARMQSSTLKKYTSTTRVTNDIPTTRKYSLMSHFMST